MALRFPQFILAFSFLACSDGLAQSVCNVKPSQPCFAEDDRAFSDAVPLSREATTVMLQTVMHSSDVRDLLKVTPKPEAPGALFKAISVQLSASNARWFLAVGTAAPTTGADNGHFWLLDLSRPKPQATLLAPANYVNLLDSRHSGFRDVKTEWCSPNECIYMQYGYIRGRYRRVSVLHTANAAR
jgi:hypothetical protein